MIVFKGLRQEMKAILRMSCAVLFCQMVLTPKPKMPPQPPCDSLPTSAQIAEVTGQFSNALLPRDLFGRYFSELTEPSAAFVTTHVGTVEPWLYPDDGGKSCGWILPISFELAANTNSNPGTRPLAARHIANGLVKDLRMSSVNGSTRLNITVPPSSILFERGRVVSWQGSFHDDRGTDLDLLNKVHSNQFVDDKTKTVVEASLGISDSFLGWRRTIYDSFSLQYGFYVRFALERAGFHRVDLVTSPDVRVDVKLAGIEAPSFGASYAATIRSQIVVHRRSSDALVKEVDSRQRVSFKVHSSDARARAGAAMNQSMADAAGKVVSELQDALATVPIQR